MTVQDAFVNLLRDAADVVINIAFFCLFVCILMCIYAAGYFLKYRRYYRANKSEAKFLIRDSFIFEFASNISSAREKHPVAFWIVALPLVFLCILGASINFGSNTQIGSLFEAREYTETYYVMMSSNGSTYYKVPATIYHNDEVYHEHDHLRSRYFIESAYFPKGGKLFFGDVYDFEYSQISLTEPQPFYDQDEKKWECLLTKERAK